MKKVRFAGNLYDACLIDGNIELQSISETIIFPNGGKELTEDAERAFYSLRYAGQRLNGFISDFIDDRIQCYVDSNKESAQILTHQNN